VPASKRATSIAAGAVALVAVAVVVLVLIGPLGASGKGGGDQPCSSYPAPGKLAASGTEVPARLAATYSVLTEPQRAVDKLSAEQVASLGASGVILSGTRLLGEAASGGRIYLVPAEHLLATSLAPPRCLSSVQRVIQQESLPLLRSEYRQVALCIVVLYGNAGTHECAPASGTPYPLLSEIGTPGFGLVPNGVSAVTVTYQIAPPQTVAVRRNFFVIGTASRTAPPCGVQWLEPTGNVKKIAVGCSFLTEERKDLGEYRAYVARKLSTLQGEVAALSVATASGDPAKAKAAWLSAHVTWLEIGQDDGAYGAFGPLGGEIDGLADGHPLGIRDPAFTGFHRIEFDLWTKHDLSAATADTATLRRLLAQLMKVPLSNYLPASATGVGNWLLRPHEVLEDALRDSLTADDDYGSGTDLASIAAGVAAVRTMLGELSPAIDPVAPHLAGDARAELDALSNEIDATRVHGAWISIQDLAVLQRQQVDAAVDAALETLAPIPDLLTSTGSNSPNT
jgi:iron uptake system EfeUOB component EfeO/EfeM